MQEMAENSKEQIIYITDCNGSETLLEAMVRHGIFLQSPCGGNGTCGKCKVRLVEPVIPLTEKEKKLLTDREQEEGVRLACCVVTNQTCTVSLPGEEKYAIQTAYNLQTETAMSKPAATSTPTTLPISALTNESFGIAIDIGTTTIVLELVDLQSGTSVATIALPNHQSAYGADVMSRISAANTGKLSALQRCIRKDLSEGIQRLLAKTQNYAKVNGKVNANATTNQIQNIVIAANTTMVHLLMGYPCDSLGVAPFTPINLSPINVKANDLLGTVNGLSCPVWILPGISTFVGGDIVAGLLATGFDKREKPALFIDLGTNGEMALGDKHGIVTASVAAGPAFEGGNLSCGVGSVEGAVYGVALYNRQIANIKTIGDKEPCGICGTGVVACMAELRKAGLLDETGLLHEAYFDEGFIIAPPTQTAQTASGPIKLTQQDIREVQLAKAAILAGIETLLQSCNITPQELETVYVAGGFGTQLNLEKAISIGLFPESFAGKLVAVGNSALAGAVQCLKAPEIQARAEKICRISKEISLSGNATFQEKYIQSMWLKRY